MSTELDIEKFLEAFDKAFVAFKDEHDFVTLYEKAMDAAGFDYSAHSEQLMEEYILPMFEGIHQEFLKNDQEALDVYRQGGLTEPQVNWRNYQAAKLNLIQKDEDPKYNKEAGYPGRFPAVIRADEGSDHTPPTGTEGKVREAYNYDAE